MGRSSHILAALAVALGVAAHSVVAAESNKPTAAVNPGAAQPTVLGIGSRRELFVDDYLIDTLNGVSLELHRPVDRGKVLDFDEPWEGPFCAYATVLRSSRGLQLYYRGSADVKQGDKGDNQVTCYAESADGLTWTKPRLNFFPRAGRSETNIVLADAAPVTHNFAPFLDEKPEVPADERYKAVGGYDNVGLYAYTSPDGIRWKRLGDQPVLTKSQVQKSFVFDSQNVSFWSAAEGKYLLYYRIYQDKKRRIGRVESDDFVHWRTPVLMEYRGGSGEPAPVEELYTNQTRPYFRAPQLYVSTAARFMINRRVLTTQQAESIGVNPKYFNDVSDAVFMTSRGGNVYQRTFMTAFVAPGIGYENWTSRTNYPACGVVQTGPTEMSVYVNQNYGQPTSHLRRYSLRLDGFASVHADYNGGRMRTKPFTFEGARLLLNFATSAAGSVRVEIQTADGNPISGYALVDCTELIGNEIEQAVTWRGGDLSALSHRPVRLLFEMKDADVFALRFAEGK